MPPKLRPTLTEAQRAQIEQDREERERKAKEREEEGQGVVLGKEGGGERKSVYERRAPAPVRAPPPPPPPEDAWAYHGVGGTAPVPTTPALRPGRQLFTGAPKGGVLLSADATVPQGTDIADAELGTKKDEDINADPRSIDQSIGNIAATYVDASSHRLGAGSAAMQEAAVPSFARFLQLVGDETDPGFSVLRGLQPEKAGGAGDIRQRKSASGAVALVKEQLPMRTVAVAHRPSASTERMTGELLVGTSGSVTAYADNDVAPLMRASALRAQLLGLLTTEAEAVRTRQAALRKDIQDSIVDDAGKHARAIVSSARSPSAQVHSELREAAQPLTDAPPLG